jgi:hypothetical protein
VKIKELTPVKTTRVVTCRNGDKIEKKEAKMESDMSSDSDSDLDEQEDDPDEEVYCLLYKTPLNSEV